MKFRLPSRKKRSTSEKEDPKYKRPLRFAEVQDRKKKRKRVVFICFGVGILLVFISMLLFVRSFFLIKHVSCGVEDETCDGELLHSAQSLAGKSMLSTLSLSHAILHAKIERLWPNGVRVHFTKPELLLTFSPSKDGVSGYSLTKEGVIVHFGMSMQELPPIADTALETLQVGDRIEEKRRTFYERLLGMSQLIKELHITYILVQDDVVTMRLDENAVAIMDTEHIESQLRALQTFLSVTTIDRHGKTIDFRFDNPVMK